MARRQGCAADRRQMKTAVYQGESTDRWISRALVRGDGSAMRMSVTLKRTSASQLGGGNARVDAQMAAATKLRESTISRIW